VFGALVGALALGLQDRPELLPVALGVALPLVPIGLAVLSVARIRRFNRRNEHATRLLDAGRLEEAAAAFEENARRFPARVQRLVSLHNLGFVRLLRCDLEGAIELLGEVDRVRAPGLIQLRHNSAALLALAYALRGDEAAAEAWIEESRQRPGTPTPFSLAHVLAEAVLRCRRAQYAEAAEVLEVNRERLELHLRPELLAALPALRAFAAPGRRPGPRGATPREAAREAVAGPAFLGARWPAMERLLSGRGS